MGLLRILVALGLLIWLAYRGWSVLLLAPAAAILAAGLAGGPLLAAANVSAEGSKPIVSAVCLIALIPAKLKEFFDRAGSTDRLFEIRLAYLRSLSSSHCEWLISASRSSLQRNGQSCPFHKSNQIRK